MGARIANRAVVTIQIIGWAAIIIVTGLFLTVIGTSITECLQIRAESRLERQLQRRP